ncbi:MAG: ABC transporter ATP-binding protein [Erysipelotrichaceae bacterium]|nr:ABC transporter ATP-binding protein [Erysipelotrichaceae bacterium]
MINIKNVTKEYVEGIKAVDNLSIHIRPGEIYGFIGPNGAGKSTTIKMITGITDCDKGEILINGISLDDEINSKLQFGYVSDSPDMFLKLKGLEYLNFLATIYNVSKEDSKKRIVELADKFELTSALGDKIQTYSHGMRQKIMVIGALLHDPKVWILDEPLTGLDPKSSYLLKEMMKEHARKGNSVFFSTHVLEVAEKLCDRIGIINKGKLVYEGTMEEIKENYPNLTLEEIFLEITQNA